MVLSFNQPSFIPWGGFFARLMASDVMVLLDKTLFAQGFTFVNRNRIKGPEGELWITVPVKKSKRGRQKIRNLEIHEKGYWSMKWLRTLKHSYCKSIHYERINERIKEILNKDSFLFIDVVLPMLELLRSELNICTEFMFQSDLGIESNGVKLLMDISKRMEADEVLLPYFAQKRVNWKEFERIGVSVKFLRYTSPVYPQFWGDYKQNLSALDLVFCTGSQGKKIIQSGTIRDGVLKL